MNVRGCLLPVLLTCCVLPLIAQAAESAKKRQPKFSAVEQLVKAHFDQQSDRKPGDIISQSDVKPVFAELEKTLHWKVADQRAILDLTPRDNELIVRKLRTKSGRAFMRSMSELPQGYDRLDRLSRLSNGGKLLDALVRGPDGYKMIEYLADTSGGMAMGKMLSETPGGQDFNQPTGRLYTVQQFLARLKSSYDAAAAASKSQPKSSATR